MTFSGTHRNVAFVVHRQDGAWKYTINEESFGHYSQRDHAISAAIQHIDRILANVEQRRHQEWLSCATCPTKR